MIINKSTNNNTKLNKHKSRNKLDAESKPQVYSCSQSPPPQFWDIFVYSGIPQLQGTSSWLWRFNPLLLRMLGEISLSLLCSHSSWGSALDLALPLHLGRLRTSVLHPDRRGLKERLIQGLWLPQAGGREGYRIRGRPVVAEASMTLQQPEVHCVFSSQGGCPWITGPWQWRATQALRRGGVDSDLCLHTGFLVAAVAALVPHAHLWCRHR